MHDLRFAYAPLYPSFCMQAQQDLSFITASDMDLNTLLEELKSVETLAGEIASTYEYTI
jgi:hypothetical protein